MKNKKLIGLAALMLALGGMAGCKKNPEPTECEHDYVFKNSPENNKHYEECTKCGDKKGGANYLKSHTWTKDASKTAENKAATCTEAGWEYQICSKCGATQQKPLPALDHDYSVVKSTTATCTAAGQNTMECSRCHVESPDKVDQAALGHQMVDDTTYEGLAASCTGTGNKRQKCSREGCDHTDIVDTPALGHKYKDGNPVAGATDYVSTITSICERANCAGKRIYWSATEVTENTKTNKRKVSDAVEASEGVEAQDAVYEDNYRLVGEDGVRFWGRPYHNACTLDADGKPESESAAAPKYDENIKGSFLEYKFNLVEKMENVKLISEMTPTGDLGSNGELYKANSDWTPGLVDSTTNKCPYRYIITVDEGTAAAQTLEFEDVSSPTPGSNRTWITFAVKAITLEAGNHTLKITMAGGYLSTYHAFGFEKVIGAAHTHEYTSDPDHLSKPATCTEKGREYGVCSCGSYIDNELPALGHHLVADTQDGDYEATCAYDGQLHQKCDREGCTYTEVTTLKATGHNFVAGQPIESTGYATITPEECAADHVKRFLINAADVNTATKTERVVTPAEGETPAVTEANYVVNDDGSVSFSNYPMNNKVRGASSKPSEADYPTMYDATAVGSFMEYDINVPEAINDVKLVMDITPTRNLGSSRKMFANDLSSDWTPGLKKVGEGDNATYEAYKTRYVISLDGAELEQDLDLETENSGTSRKWFTVPLKNTLNFTAGPHKLRIAMGGGYVCSIHQIGIQTQDPANPHAGDTPVVDDGIKLDVTKATGYNDPSTKMKSNAVFTLGEGEGKVKVAPGEYSVKISAKMTNASHTDRKWYNMAKASLCVNGEVEETKTSDQDTASQDDFRYFMMVDNTVYNPESKDNWGKIGLSNTAFNKVDFIAKIVVLDSSKTITIAHGNIGYSLYVEGVTLTRTGDHNHTVVPGSKVGESNMTTFSCACGFGGYEMSALAATDMVSGQVPEYGSSDAQKATRLGKGSAKADVWNIAGIAAGTYEVYLETQTQGGNDDAYFLAKDSIDLGNDSLNNNGKTDAKAALYRYTVKVDDGAEVNVGAAATKYKDLGVTTTKGWSKALCTIEVGEGATTITLKNNENGYAIWVFGMRLVKVA